MNETKPEKLKLFVIEDDSLDGPFVVGGIENVLSHIKTFLEEAEDGDEFFFDIQRRDMTKEELEALPEV